MYRSTPHSTTGVSPAELLFGRKPRTKLPMLTEFVDQSEVRDRDQEKKEQGKQYSDHRRQANTADLVAGDKVLLKKKKVIN